MNQNELLRICGLAFDDEIKACREYRKAQLKRQVLSNFQLLFRKLNGSRLDMIEETKFFMRHSFGQQVFDNRKFDEEYQYFLIVCDVTREVCRAMDILYEIEICDSWILDCGTLQDGVMVKQVISLSSLKQADFIVFSKVLEKVIEGRNWSNMKVYNIG